MFKNFIRKIISAGRERTGFGLGPEGKCVCTECGYEEIHENGKPCYKKSCPKCGAKMIRKEVMN